MEVVLGILPICYFGTRCCENRKDSPKMYTPLPGEMSIKNPWNIENGDRNLNVEYISLKYRQESNGSWQGVGWKQNDGFYSLDGWNIPRKLEMRAYGATLRNHIPIEALLTDVTALFQSSFIHTGRPLQNLHPETGWYATSFRIWVEIIWVFMPLLYWHFYGYWLVFPSCGPLTHVYLPILGSSLGLGNVLKFFFVSLQ